MNNIAAMIRANPSMRQSFIDIAAQRDPDLAQQLGQSLWLLDAADPQSQTPATSLAREEKGAIQQLTNLGFEQKQALVAYLTCGKNVERATSSLANNPKISKGIKPPAIGKLIGDNPLLRAGLNEFIAQKDPALAQQMKENPALYEAALRTIGSKSSPVDSDMRIVETLPLSARTSQNTNSPSFHIMKLRTLTGTTLRRLSVEFCIQPLGDVGRQAIWWTSYVIVSRPGTFTRGSGVYAEWDEFGRVLSHPPTGIIAPRTTGIQIADINKGVLNGPNTNGTVLKVVDLKGTEDNAEIFALLVATGMHDGRYQAHGQATLEYSIPSL
jgi:uncharacterized protein YneF (UPF0154 family)